MERGFFTVLGFDDLSADILDEAKHAFGESVTYMPKSGGSHSVIGIFNEIFSQVDPDTERVIASNQPTLGIKLDDIPVAPQKNDKVIVRSISYRVYDSREDGEGGTQLFLYKI